MLREVLEMTTFNHQPWLTHGEQIIENICALLLYNVASNGKGKGKGLPLDAAFYPRRAQILSASRRKPEITNYWKHFELFYTKFLHCSLDISFSLSSVWIISRPVPDIEYLRDRLNDLVSKIQALQNTASRNLIQNRNLVTIPGFWIICTA
jgi:hypothetical protein